MGVPWGEAGRSPEDPWGRADRGPQIDTLGSGGKGEEGYCYRAGAGGWGGGDRWGAMAFSGWMDGQSTSPSLEESMQQSHPVHPKSMVVEDGGLGGHLQKGTLSLLSTVLWLLQVGAAERGDASFSHAVKGR